MPIVITRPGMGVYLGTFLGMGFWSLLDSAGQDMAVTFRDEAAARAWIISWDDNNNPEAYAFVPVRQDGDYATIADLKAAGLGDLLGEMDANALRFTTPAGTA